MLSQQDTKSKDDAMSFCPKGHDSKTEDYCDECGSLMNAASSRSAPAARASENACPECSTDREPGARFCEVCQYDFANAKPNAAVSDSRMIRSEVLARQGLASLAPSAAAQASRAASFPAIIPAAPTFEAPLLARVVSDPALCPDEESRRAFPPEGIPEFIFHLDLDENLVGRDSPSKNAHPEIPVRDPGASRRHLKITRIGGKFQALELGSANGSMLDGAALVPGSPAPIGPGSSIRLGMWTRILIEAR